MTMPCLGPCRHRLAVFLQFPGCCQRDGPGSQPRPRPRVRPRPGSKRRRVFYGISSGKLSLPWCGGLGTRLHLTLTSTERVALYLLTTKRGRHERRPRRIRA